jgi:hypothetical protein
MGNNAAFTEFENNVLDTYNAGVLTPELLTKFMERYRGTDIDHGGMAGTLSKDGLDCEEITLKVFGVPIPVRPDLPKNHKTWTDEQMAINDDYWEKRSEAFDLISRGRFGWR